MAIIGTLPNNIQDGQAVDASPLMADFNFIVNQVNANGNPIGTLTAPSGTRVAFNQASAPTGWTIDTSVTDHTLQVTATGGGVVTTGNGYSTMFNAQWTSDGHALAISELASHTHGVTDPGHTHSDAGHSHTLSTLLWYDIAGNNFNTAGGGSINTAAGTGTGAGFANLNPNTTGISIQANGAGVPHSHTKTFNVNYCQCIMGVKS